MAFFSKLHFVLFWLMFRWSRQNFFVKFQFRTNEFNFNLACIKVCKGKIQARHNQLNQLQRKILVKLRGNLKQTLCTEEDGETILACS